MNEKVVCGIFSTSHFFAVSGQYLAITLKYQSMSHEEWNLGESETQES